MIAAIVDTLIVPERSPPVPHVSIAPVGDLDVLRVAMHRADQGRELLDRLALRAQRDDESRGLDVGDASLEDLRQRGFDLLRQQLDAAREPPRQYRRQHLVHATRTTSPTTDRDRGHRER